MKGWVYILKSKSKYYVGSTDNPERRFAQHAHGHTQTTRNMGAYTVVLLQEYPSLILARRIERKIKALKRKDYLEKIIKEGYIKLTT